MIELQKKMWKNGLELTERTLETLYKDKTFLKLSSMGLNMNLWWQKSLSKSSNWLFSGLNVPTEDNIKSLLEEIYSLENQFDLQEDRIRSLEKEIEELRKKTTKKAAPRATKKSSLRNAKEQEAYSH